MMNKTTVYAWNISDIFIAVDFHSWPKYQDQMGNQWTCWTSNRRRHSETLWRQWVPSNFEFLMISTDACLTKISMITLKRSQRLLKNSSNSKFRLEESTMRRLLMRKSRVSKSIWLVKKWWKESVHCRICMKMKKRRQRDLLKLRQRRKQSLRSARISIRWEETRFSSIFKRKISRNWWLAKSIWNSSMESMAVERNSSRLFWVKRSEHCRNIMKIFWESVNC